MIKQILVQKVQPARLRISDEVHFVSFLGERFAKLGGYNTATPECGITYDADFNLVHALGFLVAGIQDVRYKFRAELVFAILPVLENRLINHILHARTYIQGRKFIVVTGGVNPV